MKPLIAAGCVSLLGCLSVGCDSRTPPSSTETPTPGRVEEQQKFASDAAADDPRSEVPLNSFLVLLNRNSLTSQRNLQSISEHWQPGYATMLLELHRFLAGSETGRQIAAVVQAKLGKGSDQNPQDLWQTIWREPYQPHSQYAEFKAAMYSGIDARFEEYFEKTDNATIRLDEIVWGGVVRDGIPPLKDPEILTATEATYLADSDVVFGIVVGDDARAYPKRILAWHEMVKDVVGGLSLNGVYCTLCGSMIAYRTDLSGKHYELGTSGFLYRSNKLMYDHETKSLWSTLDGRPCVGSLVGQGIALEPYPVVTTTWGEWNRRHPQTKVLSLNTGHTRDYREGVAYRDYFATDELMFDVPTRDSRLKNKDEILIIRWDMDQPVAISGDFLKRRTIYHDAVGERRFVVVTDSSGANRVYAAGDTTFAELREGAIVDQTGQSWTISEHALVNPASQESFARIPAHRAFWFGWYAVHPETRLIQ